MTSGYQSTPSDVLFVTDYMIMITEIWGFYCANCYRGLLSYISFRC